MEKYLMNKAFNYNEDLYLSLPAIWTANGPSMNTSPVTLIFACLTETIIPSANQRNENKGNNKTNSLHRFPVIDKQALR